MGRNSTLRPNIAALESLTAPVLLTDPTGQIVTLSVGSRALIVPSCTSTSLSGLVGEELATKFLAAVLAGGDQGASQVVSHASALSSPHVVLRGWHVEPLLEGEIGGYLIVLVDLTGTFEVIHSVARKAIKRLSSWREDSERLRLGSSAKLIGRSTQMQEVATRVRRVAPLSVSVLVRGETGVGKEVVTQAIHELSDRRGKKLVTLNCAAIPKDLLESRLFGHMRGAFTGAHREVQGVFQQADGGTLFLDEVAELDLAAQAKLLRVLETSEVTPLGAENTRLVNVRLITATHRDLKSMIAEGTFREDLYYRIRVFELEIPPLRERKQDLIPLAKHFLAKAARRQRRSPLAISEDAKKAILGYSWPGNARQVRNAMEHALVTAEQHVSVADLPSELGLHASSSQSVLSPEPQSVGQAVNPGDERQRVIDALRSSNGRRGPAASLLGYSRVTLWKRIKAFEILPAEFASTPKHTDH